MEDRLNRFIEAQEDDFELALSEIKNGYKRSHWMWYIFPQLKGLGMSSTAEYYGIDGIEEAREYLSNDYLRNNLLAMCDALLSLESNDAEEILGYPDDLKLRSCMTLFNYVDPEEERYKNILKKFYSNIKDDNTIKILTKQL